MKKIRIFLALFLFGCSEEQKMHISVPKDILPVDTMVEIMSDIAIVENVIRRDYPQLAQQAEIVKNSGDSILSIYNILYERYKTSLDYYTFQPDTMIYIYEKMSDNISVKLHELNP